MFVENRQDKILEYIKKFGAVRVSDLVNEFSVSIETIRRDFLFMEKQGLLKRVHGGAVAPSNMKSFLMLNERNKEFLQEKRYLSKIATEFINEGDIISVDCGSTSSVFAQILMEKFSKLTVVTHSIDVFNTLCNFKDFKVILCAGHYSREENAFFGDFTVDIYSKIYVKKAFLFPTAISLEFGICEFEQEFVRIQKKMMESANQIFILADSSKFEKNALLKVCELKSEFVYITDINISPDLIRIYEENGIKIYNGR